MRIQEKLLQFKKEVHGPVFSWQVPKMLWCIGLWMSEIHGDIRKLLASRNVVFDEIAEERKRQNSKWGVQNHPDVPSLGIHLSPAKFAERFEIPTADRAKAITEDEFKFDFPSWPPILVEEVAEAIEQAALGDEQKLRTELIQVAAVATQWVECIDRRSIS